MPALRPLVVSWTSREVSGSLSRGERLFFTLLSEPHLLSGALDFVFLLARALKRNLVIVCFYKLFLDVRGWLILVV